MELDAPEGVLQVPCPPYPLLTLLDPPETSVPLPNTTRPTGGSCVPADSRIPQQALDACELDPLHDPDGFTGFRHSGWARDRRRVYDALRASGVGTNRLVAFRECGRHPYIFQCVERPDEYALGGSTCHDRFCMPCSRERSRTIAANVLEQIADRQARFITLTLKSTAEPLSVLLARLTSCFTKLRKTKLWRNKVTGGVAFLEVTWTGRSESWHPHFHCLVQGRYLPRKDLSRTWLKITGDSMITDIRFATDNAHVTHYITKYATKVLDHSVLHDTCRLQEAIIALKGKRLCLTFGTWRGLPLTKRIEDGTWQQIDSLRSMLNRASKGDLAAQQVLQTLEIRFAISERGPPSPTVTVVSGSNRSQYMLNLNAEFKIR